MSDIPLHLACADYSRLMPLATGEVAPEGIDLKMTMGRGGSWPLRAELLSRVLNTGEFDGGESSMGGHLLRVERGDRSFVALPIFVLRGFSEHDLYVRKDGPVRAPADLIGKRMGLYSWVASGSIWYRHSQVQMGVPLDSVDWVVGDVNMKGETSHNAALPAKVQAAPRFLAEMLAAGEIDAMWSPPRPNGFDGGNGPIVRLFPDYREAEEAYYRETGIFPMMHLVVVRREVWDRNPVIGKALVEAFNEQSFVHPSAFFAPDRDALAAWLASNTVTEEDEEPDGTGAKPVDPDHDDSEGFREAAE